MEILTVVFISYIIGSIPFGLIFTKIFISKDIRKIGSGNIGATNVLRTGNKFIALLTLLFDLLKGLIPVTLTNYYFPDYINISCLLCFLGHVFPIWLKFNGGKGVATYLGILFAVTLEYGLLFIFTWLVISLIFKYSSLSSMFASLTVFIVSLLRETTNNIFVTSEELSANFSFILFIFFILIIFTHRKNISNLKNKTEKKIKI